MRGDYDCCGIVFYNKKNRRRYIDCRKNFTTNLCTVVYRYLYIYMHEYTIHYIICCLYCTYARSCKTHIRFDSVRMRLRTRIVLKRIIEFRSNNIIDDSDGK